MNKTSILTSSFLLITAFIILSCNKNDVPGPGPKPGAKKIWKIKTNDNDSTLFAYTTLGQLHKVITTEEGNANDVVTYTFIYDPANRITEISSTTGLKYKFLYEAGKLKFTENYVGANKVAENYFEYTNNSINSITLFTPSPVTNGTVTYKPIFKTKYTYDGTGDIKKVTSYTVNPNTNALTKVNEKEIIQYDNYKNPLRILSQLTMVRIFEIPGERNILREVLYDNEGDLEETTVSSYVYDADRYPVTSSSVTTAATGTPTTRTFRYYYK